MGFPRSYHPGIRHGATALLLTLLIASSASGEDRLIVRYKSGVLSASSSHPIAAVSGDFALVVPQFTTAAAGSGAASDPCRALRDDPSVTSCERDSPIVISALPDDPSLKLQWGLAQENGIDTGARTAWDLTTGTAGVAVAVVDTGVDYRHPDLATNIWRNPIEIPNGLDDDDNGYIDDIHGINTITGGGDPLDDNGHGTHVAGIIGARGNNSVGISGVAWETSIVPVKFLDRYGGGSTFGAIQAINYVVDLKERGLANIVALNASWGSPNPSAALSDAIARAGAAGITVVAAAGNMGENVEEFPEYPAGFNLDNIISVAALATDGSLADFSNYGSRSVDIAAPGAGIYSTFKGGSYTKLSGTSMAAPFVTGAIALVGTSLPVASPAVVRDIIIAAGRPLPGLSGRIASGRMLNLPRLIELAGGGNDTPAGSVDGPMSLSALRRTWREGRRERLLLEGSGGVRQIQFMTTQTTCRPRPVATAPGSSSLRFVLPVTGRARKVRVRLLNSQGEVEDRRVVTVQPSSSSTHRLTVSSRRFAREWCDLVAESLKIKS